jgi:hypothetical protein
LSRSVRSTSCKAVVISPSRRSTNRTHHYAALDSLDAVPRPTGRRLGAAVVLIALAIGLAGSFAAAASGTDLESRITAPRPTDQTPDLAAEPRSARSLVTPPSPSTPLPRWALGVALVVGGFVWTLVPRTTEALDRRTRHRSRSLRSPPGSSPTLHSPAA